MATTEVVVTLKAPPLGAFGSDLAAAMRSPYARRLGAARAQAERNVLRRDPGGAASAGATGSSRTGSPSSCRWQSSASSRTCPGIAKAWPNVSYEPGAFRSGELGRTVALGPEVIGADKLWGSDARDRGQRDEDRDHR